MKLIAWAIGAAILYLIWYMSRSTLNRQLPDQLKMPEGLGGSSPLPPARTDAPGLPPVRSAQSPPRETIDIHLTPLTRNDQEPSPSSPVNWPLIGVGIGAVVVFAGWFWLDWRNGQVAEQARQEAAAKEAEDRAAGIRILTARELRDKGFGALQPGAESSTGMIFAELENGGAARSPTVNVTGFVMKDGQRSAVKVMFLDERELMFVEPSLPDAQSLHLFLIEIDGEVRWSQQSENGPRGASDVPLPGEAP